MGTPEEPDAIRQAYELMPKVNFSRAVLEACPEALSVSRLPRRLEKFVPVPEPHLNSMPSVLARSRIDSSESFTELMRIRPEWARSLAPSA